MGGNMSQKINSEILDILEQLRDDKTENDPVDHNLYDRVVVFGCMGVLFGISYKNVFEILSAKEFTFYKVPRAQVGLLGMINLRGEIVPIVDFRKRYLVVNCDLPGERCSTLDQNEDDKSARIIIVHAKGILFGLFVEHVIGTKTFLKESFKDEYTPIIEFSVEHDGAPTYIIKLDELF